MNELTPLAKKLVMLVASYLIIASVLVIYFKAPVMPVLWGGVLVLILVLAQHFRARRRLD